MTVHTPPVAFSSIQGDLGFTHAFAPERIRLEIMERLNVLQLGLVELIMDLSGTGSDTGRVTRMGAVGWSEAFTAMASETEAIVATGFTTNFDEVSVGRFGLAKEETYQQRILTREEGVSLDALIEMIPASWLKTIRQQLATALAAITATSGTSGQAWTVDDELDAITALHETEGFDLDRGLVSVRHPEQFSDLRDSLRNEPALQTPEAMLALQGVRSAGGAFNFLGILNHASFDITTAGGDHQGGLYVPGAVGWVRASTAPVQVANPATAMFIPEFGIVIEKSGEAKQAESRYDANSWLGTGLLDPTLFPQRRLISVND